MWRRVRPCRKLRRHGRRWRRRAEEALDDLFLLTGPARIGDWRRRLEAEPPRVTRCVLVVWTRFAPHGDVGMKLINREGKFSKSVRSVSVSLPPLASDDALNCWYIGFNRPSCPRPDRMSLPWAQAIYLYLLDNRLRRRYSWPPPRKTTNAHGDQQRSDAVTGLRMGWLAQGLSGNSRYYVNRLHPRRFGRNRGKGPPGPFGGPSHG